MRQVVGTLRLRFHECRRAGAPLSTWRELQLEILDTAKKLQRTATAREPAAGQSRATLWAMLGESFWLERDPSRLASMIDEVIMVLENHDAVSPGDPADP